MLTIQLFDTHLHLLDLVSKYNISITDVTRSSEQSHVKKFLTLTTSIYQLESTKILSEKNPNIFYGCGIHPWFINQHQQTDIETLENFVKNNINSCRAIGEIGLDKKVNQREIDKRDFNQQINWLEQQLFIAYRYNLPVSLHSRKTHNELYRILKQQKINKGVIHAFSGSYNQAKLFIDLGIKIGVGSIITYINANKTISTIKKIPLDCIVLETDSPDMLISNSTKIYNHPKNLILILQALANIRNTSIDQIAETIWHTSNSLFK